MSQEGEVNKRLPDDTTLPQPPGYDMNVCKKMCEQEEIKMEIY